MNPIMLETQKLLLQTARRGQSLWRQRQTAKELLQKVQRDCDSEANPTNPHKCEHLRMKVYQVWR